MSSIKHYNKEINSWAWWQMIVIQPELREREREI
jgi:hypothetical protein